MYEELLSYAEHNGLKVVEDSLPLRIKGLYADGIACINRKISYVAKGCALAEEIGHHFTSFGNILDKTSLASRKQEQRARRHGHQILIPLRRFIEAGQARIEGRHDVAEWLGITEEFLQESLDFYQRKYGLFVVVGEHLIHFDPLYVTMRIFGLEQIL